jgi:hypothetical protein
MLATGVRFDRDEKHLQTEILGLEWRPEFVDAATLDGAIAAVPEQRRNEAYRRYEYSRHRTEKNYRSRCLWAIREHLPQSEPR